MSERFRWFMPGRDLRPRGVRDEQLDLLWPVDYDSYGRIRLDLSMYRALDAGQATALGEAAAWVQANTHDVSVFAQGSQAEWRMVFATDLDNLRSDVRKVIAAGDEMKREIAILRAAVTALEGIIGAGRVEAASVADAGVGDGDLLFGAGAPDAYIRFDEIKQTVLASDAVTVEIAGDRFAGRWTVQCGGAGNGIETLALCRPAVGAGRHDV